MKSRRPVRGQFGGMVLFVCGMLLVGAPRLHAQQTCNATPFLGVNSWSAFVTIDGNGSGSIISNGNEYDYSVHQSIQIGPVTLTPSASDSSLYTGPENVTFMMNDQYTVINLQLNLSSSSTVTANGFTALDAMGFGANLQISALPLFCGYSFNAGNFFSPATLANNPGGTSTGLTQWGPGNIPNMLDPLLPQPQTPVAFPASGVILTGTTAFDAPPLEGTVNSPPSFNVHWTVKWTFVPNPETLDLTVTIPNYLSWRPSGGKDENDTGISPLNPSGNLLHISTQLVDKNTQKPTEFGPDQVTFSLADVSHEPGVAMNWPAKANLKSPPPPDMSFASFDPMLPTADINPGFMFNADGTQADFFPMDPSQSNPIIDISLIPYDWGGWATLNVTAMVGGISVKGHLVVPGLPVDPNETNILLPNRQSDSKVADAWKAAHFATGLADDDDAESKPNGDGQPGDGLTLYEEYRGFYMGRGCGANRVVPLPEGTPGATCQHVEGDPNMKDFFVVNRIGDGAIEGIGLFQFGSQLNVHYLGLTLDEVGKADPQNPSAYRVINFNNLGSPLHVVDQHAVILDWGPQSLSGTASVTFPTADAPLTCGYLPKHVDSIGIDLILQHEVQTEIADGYSELVTHVAHELSHSVDVCHHGDGVDHFENFFFDPVTMQVKAQGLAGLSNITTGPAVPITVLRENQLSDPMPVGLTPQELGLADSNNNPLPPEIFRIGNIVCPHTTSVVLGGESSGDVLDFMRYNDTGGYIPKGLPNVRVIVNDEDSSGVDLTDHPGGTGVNDPNRIPIPRFGDADFATFQRGKDRSQVDVNDRHSEIPRGSPGCP